MTLTQRLIRVGLTFVILGSVTAVLPGQFGSAQATTALGNAPVDGYSMVALTDVRADPGLTSDTAAAGDTKTLFTLSQIGNGNYNGDPGVTLTSSDNAIVSFNGTDLGTATSDANGQATANIHNGTGTAQTVTITATFQGGEMVKFMFNVAAT